MNALADDISKTVSLLEYQQHLYGRKVPITQEALNKFKISERDLNFALAQLVAKERSIKVIYSHVDGYPPTGNEGEIEFHLVELPANFEKRIVSKYSLEPRGAGRKMPIETSISTPILRKGALNLYSNGVLKFHAKEQHLRYQLRELLVLLVSKGSETLTADEIKEVIIESKQREKTTDATISKYISELRRALKKLTGKNIIESIHKEGWRLNFE